MKSYNNLLEQLNILPHFNKLSIIQLAKQLNLTNSTIDTYISRFLRYKKIIALKNGLYISRKFYEDHKLDVSYLFYLANVLYVPSYVSSFTALQYYNINTETSYLISSVSPKTTREYPTRIGNFEYRSIAKKLFHDFYLKKEKFSFYIASPSKALFDLLYFKTRQFQNTKEKYIKCLVDELRVDIDEMDKAEKKKFYKMIKNIYE